jgi:16S rRNA (adenine1518-N6/adenine1519-N6)-dimethyltransferase
MKQAIRDLLDRYNLKAKKKWGQNFLVEERVFDAIVRTAARAPDEWIVEIGAGLGTLTSRLAAAVPDGQVLALEHEADMVGVLRTELAALKNVEIVEGDALHFNYPAAATRAGRKLVVAGNLPYQIASPLMFTILDARAHISRAVIMLQKEMADRILAAPDTSAYGALGVMIQQYADVKPIVRAKAAAFLPPPKVDSTVIQLTPLEAGQRFPAESGAFSAVVHAAFGQRRKTLRNALRSVAGDRSDAVLATAEIDPQRRGETLTGEEFARLARSYAGAA